VTTMVVTAARGEEPAPPPPAPWRGSVLPQQWERGVRPSPALAVPVPVTRDDAVDTVSLKEAIGLALQNNPGIAAQRLEPGRQEQGILQAQSQYDPTLSSQMLYNHATTPNANVLGGNLVTVTDDRYANVHLLKTLRTGTQLTIDSLNERLDVNSRFSELRPEYKPTLALSV